MTNNKQSSVDYYITKLTEILGPEIIKQISRDDNERIARLEKQAKAMHKEECINLLNTRTFKLEDELLYGNFNSSDWYGRIRRDSTYTFHTIGYRIGWASEYPNIVKIDGQ